MILKTAEFLTAKNYSPRTVRNYTSEMKYLFGYYNEKDPELIDEGDIIAYINFIKKQFGSGYDKCRMVAQACSFFYKNILKVDYVVPSAFYPRVEHKFPNILSEDEFVHLLSCCSSLRQRCLVSMFYGTGLRLDEMCQLKLSNIDSKNMEVKVERGKGNKDRFTILPKQLLTDLRAYYCQSRPKVYLFEGRKSGKPLSNGAMQVVVRKSMQKAGFPKGKFTAHSLRHSFATHLLDAGVDLHTIKELLGHTNLETTTIYLHLQKNKRNLLVSPYDLAVSDELEG